MKYLMLLCALFLVGCAPAAEFFQGWEQLSEYEILTEKIDTWSAKQSAQLSEQFSKGFPLYESKSKTTAWMNETELAEMKSLFDEDSPKNTKVML